VVKEEALGIARIPDPAATGSWPKIWLWPNMLSLDAPFVAVLWQVLFVRCFHGDSDTATSILLVASVWLIYAADRALDAWRGERASARHRFYHQHWRMLLPLWLAVLAASAWLALTELPGVLLRRGCVLMAVVIVYFVIVHGLGRRAPALWSKEASVGLVFALGASLAAWTNVRTVADGAAIALFFVLCWINCAAIQKWESDDFGRAYVHRIHASHPAPLLSRLGSVSEPRESSSGAYDKNVRPSAVSFSAAGVALAAAVLLCLDRPVLGGAEMASAFAFVWLERARRRLSPEALRVLADVALLSPMMFLPLVRGA
jgi:hypothetical protein